MLWNARGGGYTYSMELSSPQLLVDARAYLSEGPAWDSVCQKLYWVDIPSGLLHIFDPNGDSDEIIDLEQPLGCVAPTIGGNLILGCKSGLATLRLNASLSTVKLGVLAHPESDKPGNRFNDGKCSPDGRFLAGTMDNAEKEATGSLYSLHPDGSFQTL